MELKVYRRPDRQWKCGFHASGSACPIGPDERGRCSSQKCHPQRTLRWWRSYLPIAFATVTLGVMVTLVATQRHREIIAPGPLSVAHAQLIQNPGDPHRCANCHEDSAGSFSKTTADNRLVALHTQTERCLVCHIREMPQLKRASPHDLTIQELESLTASAKNQASPSNAMLRLASLVKHQPIDWHQHQLACSDCHREHQGANHDLQAIASQRCQACHQKQFNSFADGHPEFTNYPMNSPGRLAFDHTKHRDFHFAKSAIQFNCRVCHVNGAEQGRVGQVFRSVAFETACASCHLAPMKASLPDGVIVFQLPSLDVRGLAQRGTNIGSWPDEAGQLMDGSIPPLMRLLLASNHEAERFSSRLPTSGKLSDFNIDADDDRQAISALASASRTLLEELASGGQQTFQARISSIGNAADRDLVEKLMQGVPPDLFRHAYRDWFDTGKNISWKTLKSRQHLPAGGWMIDTQRMAIVYVPTGHADPWLTAMLTLGRQLRTIKTASTTNVSTAISKSDFESLSHSILAKEGVGRCTECHLLLNATEPASVSGVRLVTHRDDTGTSQSSLWRAERLDASVRQLTRFDHGPHLIQPSLTDCVACHRMDTSSNATDISHRQDFQPMNAQDCAACHRPNAAGDNCTQCHNYHTNSTTPWH